MRTRSLQRRVSTEVVYSVADCAPGVAVAWIGNLLRPVFLRPRVVFAQRHLLRDLHGIYYLLLDVSNGRPGGASTNYLVTYLRCAANPWFANVQRANAPVRVRGRPGIITHYI